MLHGYTVILVLNTAIEIDCVLEKKQTRIFRNVCDIGLLYVRSNVLERVFQFDTERAACLYSGIFKCLQGGDVNVIVATDDVNGFQRNLISSRP